MTRRIDEEHSEIEHLHKTKDDVAEWDEPIQATPRRRRDSVVSVRFSPNELESIREATADGNISQFIREATLKAAASKPMSWSSVAAYGTSVGVGRATFVIDGAIQLSDPADGGLNLDMHVQSADNCPTG